MILIAAAIVTAAPPTKTIQTSTIDLCTIVYPQVEALKIGENYTSNIHLLLLEALCVNPLD